MLQLYYLIITGIIVIIIIIILLLCNNMSLWGAQSTNPSTKYDIKSTKGIKDIPSSCVIYTCDTPSMPPHVWYTPCEQTLRQCYWIEKKKASKGKGENKERKKIQRLQQLVKQPVSKPASHHTQWIRWRKRFRFRNWGLNEFIYSHHSRIQKYVDSKHRNVLLFFSSSFRWFAHSFSSHSTWNRSPI